MARPLLVEFAGVLYYIRTRGDRREPIYGDDEDRYLFLQTLAEVVKRCNWFCVPDEQQRLLVVRDARREACEKGMHRRNRVYTQARDRRHRRRQARGGGLIGQLVPVLV